MGIGDILAGARFAAIRAIDRFITQPRRQKAWARQRAPFRHHSGEGYRFTLYPGEYVDQHIFVHGIYEKRFLQLLRGRFDQDAIALDIGANIGNHAIYLAGTFAVIHAFEPNPTVLSRLRDNIALNGLDDDIRVHPVGLGATTEILAFRENNDGNLGASGFLKADEEVDALTRVSELQIVNADEYVGQLALPRLDFVKVDVEGWEASLFEGLSETIRRHRPVVAFEFHGQDAAPGEYDRILAALPGYVIAEPTFARAAGTIIEKAAWNVTRRGRPSLERIDRPDARTYENLLGFPDAGSFERFAR
ncbi:FkbM family methyltransferase [Sphingomonas sp. 1P08PE]|uniref:FkbM family methyltransferase n=1 Tax=Sphingomonas sp. 1P08PE TaxID=554122 RepID=UPI0039A2853A